MLEPDRLDRARLVEDKDDEESEEIIGTKISDDVVQFGDDTLFPLQAALGYDVIQTLLIGPEVLLVEGPSDMIYFRVMSDILQSKGRESLTHRWTLVPVGGADNASQFVSLFGASGLETAVVLDGDEDINQRMGGILNRGLIQEDNILTIDEYVGSESDIEDMFYKDFYINLVEDTYRQEFRFHDDVDGVNLDRIDFQHPRVVKELERYFEAWMVGDGNFSHKAPARHLQQYREEYEDEIPDEDLERFEELFENLNSILED
jgi:predicted ATP-dependent endonuclease of OLD family